MPIAGIARLAAVCALAASISSVVAGAWGAQGHRLVGLLATERLTPVARQNVLWMLGSQTLADVSSWADAYLEGNYQTSYWHYVNIPADATRYDRDRDCPRQPGVGAGAAADKWRDCVIERITYNRERLATTTLDRADRAIALKFLVHFVGDLHQPFHALGVERGGNGIPVSAFGVTDCGNDPARPFPCNLHGVWDVSLVGHRHLDDRAYVALLNQQIRKNGWDARPVGTPAEWAMQSHALAKTALVAPRTSVDEAYFRTHIATVDERLALGGLRLAALLNSSLNTAPRE